MVIRTVVRENDYRDSVVLMRVSSQLEVMNGVRKASAIMATDNNKRILRDAGLLTDEVKHATPNDLAIILNTDNPEQADHVMSAVDGLLVEKPAETAEMVRKTWKAAKELAPDSNLTIISVPGPFAAREAMTALENGQHVFIFSDGVPIEDELKLKKFGHRNGLLVMGPDCGTAIINGIGIGFSNMLQRGPIGIVGASGTGIQQVSSLIDEVGVSQAIGTGSNDLKDKVGGITMRMGLKLLDRDENTKVVVVISKPPSNKVAKEVLKVIRGMEKPVVVYFIGGAPSEIKKAGAIPAFTLEDAALKATSLANGDKPKSIKFTLKPSEIKAIVKRETKSLTDGQKYIRGLFSGGTFCYETLLILKDLVGGVHSNTLIDPKFKLSDVNQSKGHTCIDMGTVIYTVGRPHPMIDFRFRQERLIKEASDAETAVIILDIVLGYGSHQDPAGEIAPIIKEAKDVAKKKGRYLPVIASICGTRRDPQDLLAQQEKLKEVRAVLMPSNAQAARMAALVVKRGKIWRMIK